jgi:putative NIF3 family GTP cyclohydrolase 1 type 2
MKTLRTAISFAMILSALAAVAEPNSQKSFALLKSFSGSWEGNNAQGKPVQVSFRTTAAGSALMSEITMPEMKQSEDMISMFHMDNDRLMLTHYCSVGNQPRMVASLSADGKTVTFDFLDATNLANPKTGHMNRVILNMVDANHHTEEWRFIQDGKEIVESFDLHRKS